MEVADVDALALVGGGLLVEPILAAAAYSAHENFCLRLFAEIIRQVYTRRLLFPANIFEPVW
jgi:hypothetical protein